MKAGILIIGNEVLSGETLDSNAAFLGKQLNLAGFEVVLKLTIPDVKGEIMRGLDFLKPDCDVIVISGGLGPTNDDITKKTLTQYFNDQPEFRDEILTHIKELLKGRYPDSFPEHLREQAIVPSSCLHLTNHWGTASGMWFEQNGKVFVSLPGVPMELHGIFSEHVIPRLKKMNRDQRIINRNIKTIGIPEAIIAEKIKDIENALPSNIRLAYLPSHGQVKLRLTAYGRQDDLLETEVQKIIDRIVARVNNHVYGFDEENIEEVIGKMLKASHKTIGTAESCTGGYLAHLITSIPGSSAYFKGSVIAYSNEIKMAELNVSHDILETSGAVSQSCVEAMAQGLLNKFDVDYALATSGIAGPDGGTADKPVGTIWIAVASRKETQSYLFNFNRGREQNIKFTSFRALLMLWQLLKKEQG